MFRRILVAYDHSTDTTAAVEQALGLARSEHVESVTLLTVIAPVSPSVAWSGLSPEALRDDAHASALRELRRVADASRSDVSIRLAVRDGHAGPTIVQAARDGGHDLIVMGSRGRGPLGSRLMGSVSTYVLQHTDAAVLVLHPCRQDADASTARADIASVVA